MGSVLQVLFLITSQSLLGIWFELRFLVASGRVPRARVLKGLSRTLRESERNPEAGLRWGVILIAYQALLLAGETQFLGPAVFSGPAVGPAIFVLEILAGLLLVRDAAPE